MCVPWLVDEQLLVVTIWHWWNWAAPKTCLWLLWLQADFFAHRIEESNVFANSETWKRDVTFTVTAVPNCCFQRFSQAAAFTVKVNGLCFQFAHFTLFPFCLARRLRVSETSQHLPWKRWQPARNPSNYERHHHHWDQFPSSNCHSHNHSLVCCEIHSFPLSWPVQMWL